MFPVLVPQVDRFHSFSMGPQFSPSSTIKRHTNAHSSVTASQYCARVEEFRFLADVFIHTEGSAGQTLNSGEKKLCSIQNKHCHPNAYTHENITERDFK